MRCYIPQTKADESKQQFKEALTKIVKKSLIGKYLNMLYPAGYGESIVSGEENLRKL